MICPVTQTGPGLRYCKDEGYCPYGTACANGPEDVLPCAARHFVRRELHLLSQAEPEILAKDICITVAIALDAIHAEADASWCRCLAALFQAADEYSAKCDECIHPCSGKSVAAAYRAWRGNHADADNEAYSL